MKNKGLVLSLIIIILGGSIFFIYKKVATKVLTVEEKLIKNKYEDMGNESFFKKVNASTTYHFNFEFDVKYFIININDEHQIYFFEKDQAKLNDCEYNLENNKVLDEANCSSDELKKIEALKKTFLKEIKKAKITLEDLKKV